MAEDLKIEDLASEITKYPMPRHIAIIMDGNGRWAKARKIARIKGHAAGTKIIKSLITECSDLGVEVLTLYCFSTENWLRPKEEVSFLMNLIHSYLQREANDMVNKGVKLRHMGDLSAVPQFVRDEIFRVEALTASSAKIVLNIAVNYGSRQEIVSAVRKVAEDVKNGAISVDAIDDSVFEGYLETAGLPDPDLMIRTSGELRLSNFLLWQMAYAEFYFTDVKWPDFDRLQLYKAIYAYQHRHRRFGGLDSTDNG